MSKLFVEWARAGAWANLTALLRSNDEISREVRDYLVDVIAGKEKIKHVKQPAFTWHDCMDILVLWARYTDPVRLAHERERARIERRGNRLGKKMRSPLLSNISLSRVSWSTTIRSWT